MGKVKAAVSETDFQDIKKGILDTLKNEKDYLCDYNYSTPTEATNRIYSMLTEIIIMEAGQLINYDFKAIVQERSEIKRKVSQIDYNTNKANAIKFSCDALLMESRVAIEDLIKAAQEERKKETTKDANKDRLRDETAARMQYSLQKGELPTIVTGTRKSPEEIPIFEFELQALSQEIRDKLKTSANPRYYCKN